VQVEDALPVVPEEPSPVKMSTGIQIEIAVAIQIDEGGSPARAGPEKAGGGGPILERGEGFLATVDRSPNAEHDAEIP
jgi:hypothetical protein